jgi:hypothetical protein
MTPVATSGSGSTSIPCDRGPVRFARYASPPNRLGYCGPGAAREFNELIEADAVAELRQSAREFAAAYPYLELLAGANRSHDHHADPLADAVVEAYWIGNPLLTRVEIADFGRSIDDRFRRRAGRDWNHVELSVPNGAANHAYHVLVASPWVGLMREGVVDEPLAIVDSCRISWGTVVGASGSGPLVRRTPMVWTQGQLGWGMTGVEQVVSPISVAVGDIVSLHWGQVCEVLTPEQLRWLVSITISQMEVARRIGRPY